MHWIYITSSLLFWVLNHHYYNNGKLCNARPTWRIPLKYKISLKTHYTLIRAALKVHWNRLNFQWVYEYALIYQLYCNVTLMIQNPLKIGPFQWNFNIVSMKVQWVFNENVYFNGIFRQPYTWTKILEVPLTIQWLGKNNHWHHPYNACAFIN